MLCRGPAGVTAAPRLYCWVSDLSNTRPSHIHPTATIPPEQRVSCLCVAAQAAGKAQLGPPTSPGPSPGLTGSRPHPPLSAVFISRASCQLTCPGTRLKPLRLQNRLPHKAVTSQPSAVSSHPTSSSLPPPPCFELPQVIKPLSGTHRDSPLPSSHLWAKLQPGPIQFRPGLTRAWPNSTQSRQSSSVS